jgi:hypothetical protein
VLPEMMEDRGWSAQQDEGADAVTGFVNGKFISRVKGKNEEKLCDLQLEIVFVNKLCVM